MYARIIRSRDINCQTSPCLLFIHDLSEGKKCPLWERNQEDLPCFSRAGRSRAVKVSCCCVWYFFALDPATCAANKELLAR